MIAGLDSSIPPPDSVLAAAYSSGVRLWAGYFAGPGIANGWALSDFNRVKLHGMGTIAFCSGWSDPTQIHNQSVSWGVPACLDVESGIRDDGSWVEGWLSTSGAGLYGNGSVHYNSIGVRPASFHIFSGYFGYDPASTWPSFDLQPSVPCAWQWEGSHAEFGWSVDRAWYDDIFSPIKLKRSKAVMTVGANSINVFVRGGDLALWQNRFNGTSWTGWRTWNGRLGSPEIAVARGSDGSLRVFVHGVNPDGTPAGIYETVSLDDGLTFSAFDSMGLSVGNGDGLTAVGVIPVGTPTVTVDFSPILAETTKIETAIANLPTISLQPVLNAIAALPPETDVTPVLAAIANVQSSINALTTTNNAIKTEVDAIKVKTDKDLA